jgi:hypothetical protein
LWPRVRRAFGAASDWLAFAQTYCGRLAMFDAETLAALAAFPDRLERCLAAVPAPYLSWAPPSWEGIPSETLTPLEQACHVRDIEREGYLLRFRRLLHEEQPLLASIDGYALVRERDYAHDDAQRALGAFRAARAETVTLLRGLDAAQWRRRGAFEGYGAVTVRGLAHYLCSHDHQHLAGLQWLLGKMEER